MITLNGIADVMHKGKCIIITRDQHGKYYVSVDSVMTQKRLNANEIVRYLINCLEDATVA